MTLSDSGWHLQPSLPTMHRVVTTTFCSGSMLMPVGASKLSIVSMIAMLQGMNRHVWMAYRDPFRFANHTKWAAPLANIGKGNGLGNDAGHQTWVAVSPLLL